MRKWITYILVVAVAMVIVLSVLGIGAFIWKFINRDNDPVLVKPNDPEAINVLFLHHSTGRYIWNGGLKDCVDDSSSDIVQDIHIYDQEFPKRKPYGWQNYPYDYWNIWVNNAGDEPYKREPTLEMITEHYDVVVFKHCFPVSAIKPDDETSKVDSSSRTLGNYKLQYDALKEKINKFNDTKFILWTTPALVEPKTNEQEALRTKEFNEWIINEWNTPGDNIFLWDFYSLETDGGLYLREENAKNPTNSHPSTSFSESVAPYLCNRIIDVIEGRGDETDITGKR